MISMDEVNVLDKAKKAIFEKIEAAIGSGKGPVNGIRFKAITDGICALGVIGQIEQTRRQEADSPKRYCTDGKCEEFNAYMDGDGENKGTLLAGVEKVILPNLQAQQRGTGYDAGVFVTLEFNSLENAAAVLDKPGVRRRLEIRGAVQRLDRESGYTFHGHQYIMDVCFIGLEQVPLERRGRTVVSAVFKVDSYTAIVDGKTLWETRRTEEPPGPPREG